ncbi:MAG: dihydrofolate reductase [Myxococcales bacterium]|nr:MAG: dihydrofolate reductase [Myxococcales bacterium]
MSELAPELSFACIAALDQQRGIGAGGNLPWHLPEDMAYFRKITTTSKQGLTNAVIMGRKTWESIPEPYRPLAGRTNIVLSRNKRNGLPGSVHAALSFEDALTNCKTLQQLQRVDQLFVIGGAQLYAHAIALTQCKRLFLTRIEAAFECDAFFPPFESDFALIASSAAKKHKDLVYRFEEYHRN